MNNMKRGMPVRSPMRRPMPGRPIAGHPRGRIPYKPRPMPGRNPLQTKHSSIFPTKTPITGGPRKGPLKKPNKKGPNILIIGLGIVVFIVAIILIWVSIVDKEKEEPINYLEGDLELKISKVLVEGDLVKVSADIGEGDNALAQIKFIVESKDNQEVFIESYTGTKEFFLNLKDLDGGDVYKVSIFPILKDSKGGTYTGKLADTYVISSYPGDYDHGSGEEPPINDFEQPNSGGDNYQNNNSYFANGSYSNLNNSGSNTSNSFQNNTQICIPNYSYDCLDGNAYWYDSCGNLESLKDSCSYTEYCFLGTCVPVQQEEEDDCGNNLIDEGEYCDGSNLGQETCASFGFNSGNLLCNDQCQFDISSCYNQAPQNPENPEEPECTPEYTSLCSGGDVYWYDSCGSKGSIRYDCTSGQTCSVDSCVDLPPEPEPEPWETGIVSWWSFDSDASDSAEGGNDGSVYGASLVSSGCKSSGCYDFDGINDYIDVGTFSIPGDKLTISAWVKWEGSTYPIDPRIIAKAHGTEVSEHVFLLGLDDTSSTTAQYRFRFTSGGSTLNYVAGSATLDNAWHHIVAVYNGDSARIYVDKILVGSTSKNGNLQTNSDPVYIGKNPVTDPDGGRYWNGKLDEIMIWNRALSSSEISQLYDYF